MEQLKQALTDALGAAFQRAAQTEGWPATTMPEVQWEYPPDPAFGDLSTPVSFSLAKLLRRRPREIAVALQRAIKADPLLVDRVEVAGAGYLNVFVATARWQAIIPEILAAGTAFGRAELGNGRRVQVEFVSANPTGPLHVGHGRGAALGDAIASLLEAVGYRVEREFYINDAGTQVRLLGESVWARLQEAAGRPAAFPENGYHGEYVRDVASQLAAADPGLMSLGAGQGVAVCAERGAALLLEEIKADLRDFGVVFDSWFSEKRLFESGEVEAALATLRAGGYLYEDGRAVGFRASDFGDEKDRILIRSTGEPTYFTSDIAYHANKIRRGFDKLINIWGADHGGYVKRMTAAVAALSDKRVTLDVKLCQLVKLMRAGEPVKMSKRAGDFVTLREVVDEVGVDAVRFMMLYRKNDAPLDFDLAKVIEQSKDNPVFYVQYAHARGKSALRQALAAFPDIDLSAVSLAEADLALLADEGELVLARMIAQYPRVIEAAAAAHEPHRVAFYLHELSSVFHSHWNRGKDQPQLRFVKSEERELTIARVALVSSLTIVLGSGLRLLGVSAPDEMR